VSADSTKVGGTGHPQTAKIRLEHGPRRANRTGMRVLRRRSSVGEEDDASTWPKASRKA